MLNKVCFEQKVVRRAQSFPLKGNRRVETLRRLSKLKISEEINAYEREDEIQEVDSQEKGQRLKPLNTDKIFQGGRSQNLRRRSDNNRQIGCGEEPGPLVQHPTEQRKCSGEEQIPSVRSEREGPATVGSGGKHTRLNPCVRRRSGLVKVPKSQSDLGPSIIKEDRWRKIHNFRSLWTRRRRNNRSKSWLLIRRKEHGSLICEETRGGWILTPLDNR
jgi:hypothetical protein